MKLLIHHKKIHLELIQEDHQKILDLIVKMIKVKEIILIHILILIQEEIMMTEGNIIIQQGKEAEKKVMEDEDKKDPEKPYSFTLGLHKIK